MGRESFLKRVTVSPGAFIPLAEATGLIVPIGAWALNEACRQAVAWQRLSEQHGPDTRAWTNASGLSGLKIGVNISAWQIQHPDIVSVVRDALETSGLAPENLTLEITEASCSVTRRSRLLDCAS